MRGRYQLWVTLLISSPRTQDMHIILNSLVLLWLRLVAQSPCVGGRVNNEAQWWQKRIFWQNQQRLKTGVASPGKLLQWMSGRLLGNQKWMERAAEPWFTWNSEKTQHIWHLQMAVLNPLHMALAFNINRNSSREIRIGPKTLCSVSPDTQSWY